MKGRFNSEAQERKYLPNCSQSIKLRIFSPLKERRKMNKLSMGLPDIPEKPKVRPILIAGFSILLFFIGGFLLWSLLCPL